MRDALMCNKSPPGILKTGVYSRKYPVEKHFDKMACQSLGST